MTVGVGQVVAWYICTIVAVIFLICRLVIRWQKFKHFYIDDYLLTLACCCLIGDLGIQHYMFTLGMADTSTSTKSDTISMMKMIIPGSVLYVTSLWLIKAGMVCFYKRLADRTRYQQIYNVTLGVLGAMWLTIFFDIIFKCFPVDRVWDVDHPERTCSSYQSTVNYWITILFNIFSDVFIICLPISQVMKLRMPLKQKIGVLSIFLLGILVVITSIIRAIYAYKNQQMITCTVSMVETAIAIIASCLPVLRTLFFGSKSRNGTYSRRRAYELSTSGNTMGLSTRNKHVAAVSTSGNSGRGNESEDELWDKSMNVKPESPGAGGVDEVVVTREYRVHSHFDERGDAGIGRAF